MTTAEYICLGVIGALLIFMVVEKVKTDIECARLEYEINRKRNELLNESFKLADKVIGLFGLKKTLSKRQVKEEIHNVLAKFIDEGHKDTTEDGEPVLSEEDLLVMKINKELCKAIEKLEEEVKR